MIFLYHTCILETSDGGAQLVLGGIQSHGDDDGCSLLLLLAQPGDVFWKGRSSCISLHHGGVRGRPGPGAASMARATLPTYISRIHTQTHTTVMKGWSAHATGAASSGSLGEEIWFFLVCKRCKKRKLILADRNDIKWDLNCSVWMRECFWRKNKIAISLLGKIIERD